MTRQSVGKHASEGDQVLAKRTDRGSVVALCGNPNVGKSTVFNALTGMNQHTGNWTGKTVSLAGGACRRAELFFVDLPGTYSLLAHSPEEEVARDAICFGDVDAVVVVCDATALERNLILALQIMEIHPRVILCVNLLDEAKRKHISVDLPLLEQHMGVPVIGTVARREETLRALTESCQAVIKTSQKPSQKAQIEYPAEIERALLPLVRALELRETGALDPHWLARALLDGDTALIGGIERYLGEAISMDADIFAAQDDGRRILEEQGIDREGFIDLISFAAVETAERLAKGVTTVKKDPHRSLDRKLDRILTGRRTAYPVMLLLLAFIFWLTISLSNIPSAWLERAGEWLLGYASKLLLMLHAPPWLHGVLVEGILQVLFRVVSVMLPPMAIFFPLFTLLEDAGYLPRVAYNLDRPFARCHACGKQALTMCMGLGCNAAGVVGCRIIDSPRERMLAILTNSFVPCNGRFPALISILTVFFIFANGWLSSLLCALMLCALILLSIAATFAATKLLSRTLLKGVPSSFVLEMPPYRVPQFGRVLVRSIFDRTLFVLGRAAVVAAPAGLLIWCMANIWAGDMTLLAHVTEFLNPLGRALGMDGAIITAFILGSPANEIVIPLMLMAYLSTGSMAEVGSVESMRALFTANGWTAVTAVCVLIFFLFHWPCTTTLLTVKKETGSLFWTTVAAILPTLFGALICFSIRLIAELC